MSKQKRIFNIIINAVFIAVFVFVLVCAGWAVATTVTQGQPNIFGFRIYRIATGSMQPDLMVGDFIISRVITNPDDVLNLNVGDAVTFLGTIGTHNVVITHKLVEICQESREIVTKAIYPVERHDSPTPFENVRGVSVMRITRQAALGIIIGAVALVVAVAILSFVFKNFKKNNSN
jgi:signal peptidase